MPVSTLVDGMVMQKTAINTNSVMLCFGLCLAAASFWSSPTSAAVCASDTITVTSDFDGGAMASCAFSEETGELTIEIAPEDERINPSPWYAFRVYSEVAQPLQVRLRYGEFKHRYQPKLSLDRQVWRSAPEGTVAVSPSGHEAVMILSLPAQRDLWLSAQPLMTSADYDQWIATLTNDDRASNTVVGPSLGGKALHRVTTEPQQACVLILGRQHPPETTGAVAMQSFVARLMADDDLAQSFRAAVGVILYPLVNPDGVDKGHWRHNLGGVDLNRDWGPFTQPETRLIAEDLDRYVQMTGCKLIKSLDFHSTHYDIFYTQEDGDATVRPELLGAWMAGFEAAMQAENSDFAITRKSSHNANLPTAKTYFYAKYGIASSTFELGDNTPLDEIAHYAAVAAEVFMSVAMEDPE